MDTIEEQQGADFPDEEVFPDEEQGANEANPDEQGAQTTAETEATTQPLYNLCSRTNPNNAAFKDAMDEPYNSKSYFPPMQLFYKDIFPEFAFTMTQMLANAGIKEHGRKAKEALLAKFAQFEDLDVYKPIGPIQTHESTEEGHTQGHKSHQG